MQTTALTPLNADWSAWPLPAQGPMHTCQGDLWLCMLCLQVAMHLQHIEARRVQSAVIVISIGTMILHIAEWEQLRILSSTA